MKDTIKNLTGTALVVAVITYTGLKVTDLYYKYSGDDITAKANRAALKNKITNLNPFKKGSK